MGAQEEQKTNKQAVVLKFGGNSESRALLQNEYQVLGELEHPAIIQPFKTKGKLPYIVLPLCKHGDLFDLVEKSAGMSENQAKLVFR